MTSKGQLEDIAVTVPTSVAMQLGGSAVKVKAYFSQSDYKALAQASSCRG